MSVVTDSLSINKKGKLMEYPLSLDKVYADCASCDAVHIVDKYVTYHFCNHCRSSLRKRGA